MSFWLDKVFVLIMLGFVVYCCVFGEVCGYVVDSFEILIVVFINWLDYFVFFGCKVVDYVLNDLLLFEKWLLWEFDIVLCSG